MIYLFLKKFQLKNNEINLIKGVGINLNKYKKNYANSKNCLNAFKSNKKKRHNGK